MHVAWNANSAATGYNQLIDQSRADICVLAHHDVYLPEGWRRLLLQRISQLQRHDPNWAVIAAYGVGLDGRHWGPVWSSSLSAILGSVTDQPVPIQSADELLIILRTDIGLRFDEKLPHFHFHGLDIVQTVLAQGYGAYSLPLPLIHNDRFSKELSGHYRSCYHYIRRKWRSSLPLSVTTTKVSRHGLHLYKSLWRMTRYTPVGSDRATDTDTSPLRFAKMCGWSSVQPPEQELPHCQESHSVTHAPKAKDYTQPLFF